MNYERNLFKHNQELITENENLRQKIAKIETNTENKYFRDYLSARRSDQQTKRKNRCP